jgi:hypothetical protein
MTSFRRERASVIASASASSHRSPAPPNRIGGPHPVSTDSPDAARGFGGGCTPLAASRPKRGSAPLERFASEDGTAATSSPRARPHTAHAIVAVRRRPASGQRLTPPCNKLRRFRSQDAECATRSLKRDPLNGGFVPGWQGVIHMGYSLPPVPGRPQTSRARLSSSSAPRETDARPPSHRPGVRPHTSRPARRTVDPAQALTRTPRVQDNEKPEPVSSMDLLRFFAVGSGGAGDDRAPLPATHPRVRDPARTMAAARGIGLRQEAETCAAMVLQAVCRAHAERYRLRVTKRLVEMAVRGRRRARTRIRARERDELQLEQRTAAEEEEGADDDGHDGGGDQAYADKQFRRWKAKRRWQRVQEDQIKRRDNAGADLARAKRTVWAGWCGDVFFCALFYTKTRSFAKTGSGRT